MRLAVAWGAVPRLLASAVGWFVIMAVWMWAGGASRCLGPRRGGLWTPTSTSLAPVAMYGWRARCSWGGGCYFPLLRIRKVPSLRLTLV